MDEDDQLIVDCYLEPETDHMGRKLEEVQVNEPFPP